MSDVHTIVDDGYTHRTLVTLARSYLPRGYRIQTKTTTIIRGRAMLPREFEIRIGHFAAAHPLQHARLCKDVAVRLCLKRIDRLLQWRLTRQTNGVKMRCKTELVKYCETIFREHLFRRRFRRHSSRVQLHGSDVSSNQNVAGIRNKYRTRSFSPRTRSFGLWRSSR